MALRYPIFRPQIGDPTTTLDPYICTLESGAMALDVKTNGRIQVWGGNLVPWCGRSAYTIRQKGTNLNNVATAWKHWGQTLDIDSGGRWTNVLTAIKSGYFIIAQGDYDQFSLATRCQDSFTQDHAVLIAPRISGNYVIMGDPLCKTWKWVPLAELRRYMEKLGRRVYDRLGWYWTGQLYYAKIKSNVSTATVATEVQVAAYKATITQRINQKIKVKSDARYAAVQLHDGEFVWLPAGAIKDAYAKINIYPAIPGGKVGANRRDGYLVGAEAAIILLSDATLV